MREMTIAEWAYLAGIIDGEGCITINRQATKRKKTGAIYVFYTLFVTIRNTDYAMIKWLADRFGSTAYPITTKKNRRQVWSWCVASDKAEYMLTNVLPYLVVKKEQAQLSLVFRRTYQGSRPCRHRPISPNVVEFRQQCVAEMKRLKRINHHDEVSA